MSRRNRHSSHQARHNKHADHSAVLPRMSEDDLYERVQEEANPLLLILDGIEDPHNLGACLRSADAAGVFAVVAPKKHTVSVTETVRSIAVGAAEHVPYIQVTNLANCMDKLRELGITLVGTSDAATEPIFDISLTGPLAIVMGTEAKGIRRLTAEKCDHLALIPMNGHVNCLNLSVATGICLFEAEIRDRKIQGLKLLLNNILDSISEENRSKLLQIFKDICPPRDIRLFTEKNGNIQEIS